MPRRDVSTCRYNAAAQASRLRESPPTTAVRSRRVQRRVSRAPAAAAAFLAARWTRRRRRRLRPRRLPSRTCTPCWAVRIAPRALLRSCNGRARVARRLTRARAQCLETLRRKSSRRRTARWRRRYTPTSTRRRRCVRCDPRSGGAAAAAAAFAVVSPNAPPRAPHRAAAHARWRPRSSTAWARRMKCSGAARPRVTARGDAQPRARALQRRC